MHTDPVTRDPGPVALTGALVLAALLAAGALADPIVSVSPPTPPPDASPSAAPVPGASEASAPVRLALIGGRVRTMAGRTYEGGRVVVEGDRITDVGGPEVDVPPGAAVVDCSGKTVLPGLIDAHTTLGLVEVDLEEETREADEATDPFVPHLSVLDGFNPASELLRVTRLNGVTAALVVPEDANLMSGQSSLVDLGGGPVADVTIKSPVALHLNLGLPPRGRGRSKGRFSTRMGMMAEIRELFLKAREYKKKWDKYDKEHKEYRESVAVRESSPATTAVAPPSPGPSPAALPASPAPLPSPGAAASPAAGPSPAASPAPPRAEGKAAREPPEEPSRDLKLDVLLAVLKGGLPVMARAHREDDIRRALALAREHGFKLILDHATEGHRLAGEIARARVPVVVGPINTQPDSWETLGAAYQNAARLFAAGVEIAIQTGDAHNVRNLPYQAGLAAAYGLPPDEALRAITANPARILGVADRIGTIEKGRLANLLVATGDVLQPRTVVEKVYIRGRPVPMTSKQTELFERFRKKAPR